MRVLVWNRVAAFCGLLLLALLVMPFHGWSDVSVERRILTLAGEGQDQAAISLYERELEPEDASVEVLRAVAGSYWRLRRFEDARELYRTIMNQQPALAGLTGGEADDRGQAGRRREAAPATLVEPVQVPEAGMVAAQPEEPALIAEPVELDEPAEVEADPEDALPLLVEDLPEAAQPLAGVEKGVSAAGELELAEVAEPAEVAVLDTGTDDETDVAADAPSADVTASAFHGELDELRSAYLELEQERERQRRQVEARILEMMSRTEATVQQLDVLREARARAETERAEAVSDSQALREALQQQREELGSEIAGLREEVALAEQAYKALESETGQRVAELERALEEVRAAATSAAERETELEQELAALASRETALEEALRVSQRDLEAAQQSAAAERADLEARRLELAEQLDTERVAARARRDAFQEREATLQQELVLSEQDAEQLEARLEQLQGRIEASEQRVSNLEAERQSLVSELQKEQDAQRAIIKERDIRENALKEQLDARQSLYEEAQQTLARLLDEAEANAQARDALTNELAAEQAAKERLEAEFRQVQEQTMLALQGEQSRTAELTKALVELQQEQAAERLAADARQSQVEEEQERLEASLRDLREKMASLLLAAEQQEEELQRIREQSREREAALAAELAAAQADLEQSRILERQLVEDHARELALMEAELARYRADYAGLEEVLMQRDRDVDALREQLAVSMQHAVLQVALQEIALLEQDFQRTEQDSQREQARLLGQVAALERSLDRGQEERATLREELRRARARQEEVLAESLAREETLRKANETIDEATAALARQYDALREQLESGVRMRLEGDLPEAEDLSPLILRLEEATETATLEARNLREQFELERQAMADALQQVSEERDVLAEALATLQARQEQERVGDQDSFAAQLQEIEEGYRAKTTQLESEIETIRASLQQAEQKAESMQAKWVTEREGYVRGLDEARTRVAQLMERIAGLEATTGETTIGTGGGGDAPADAGAGKDDALLRAMQSRADEDREAALLLFEQRDGDQPVSQAVLRLAGSLYRSTERYAEAYAVFSELLERDPSNVYAEQGIVMSLFDMGEYDQALERLSDYGMRAETIEEK